VLCNPHYKSMKTYETFSENMCLAGDDEGNAADACYKLFQSYNNILNNLKRLPRDPRAALKSMMEPPETRIRNVHRHNVIKPIMELAESETRHFLFGITPKQFLVYGHTHVPYVKRNRMVANTGSWGFGDEMKCHYLEIDQGVPELNEFK
ncbi:MAG: hypothetical protein JXA38_02570, partial [Methanosarcinaceae archaeon]|nr:hypothetical protein [Methanosarcinaceae archaeon]